MQLQRLAVAVRHLPGAGTDPLGIVRCHRRRLRIRRDRVQLSDGNLDLRWWRYVPGYAADVGYAVHDIPARNLSVRKPRGLHLRERSVEVRLRHRSRRSETRMPS